MKCSIPEIYSTVENFLNLTIDQSLVIGLGWDTVQSINYQKLISSNEKQMLFALGVKLRQKYIPQEEDKSIAP